jgi:tRNA/tmRNA/rRNA uracil-C5-methylase (TrmA/RlmC/RlmD family)
MTVLKAEDAVYGGYVLSRADGVIFIRGAIPGEVVEVGIDEKKRDYSVGSVVDVIEPSEARTEPPCQYYGECGGCQLQFVSYEKQVGMKEDVLLDCLKRIGRIETELSPSISGSPLGYRHRAQFKVSRDGKIGFFREASIDVVEIDSCPLMTGSINDALKNLRGMDLAGIREIHITAGDTLLGFLKCRDIGLVTADMFLEAGFSGVAFEDGTYKGTGAPYAGFDLNGMRYTVSPWSFFQSNWAMNREVVSLLADELGPAEGKRVLDLYAGGGNFSLHLAADADETVAVEENPYCISDGKRNRSTNRITNFRFVKGQAESARLEGPFDITIIDPPRQGLTNVAMERVLKLGSPLMAYISCNPSTFARDLGKLSDSYELGSVRMADLFPNTYHLEAVAILRIKEN